MDEPMQQGISRRSAVRRIGIGAAAVWSAPAIVSVSRAGAASLQPEACTQCPPIGQCGGFPECGQPGCNCWGRPVAGGCFCSPDGPCDTAIFPPCPNGLDSECPNDWVCTSSCCDPITGFLCGPPCSAGGNASFAGGSGPRKSG